MEGRRGGEEEEVRDSETQSDELRNRVWDTKTCGDSFTVCVNVCISNFKTGSHAVRSL